MTVCVRPIMDTEIIQVNSLAMDMSCMLYWWSLEAQGSAKHPACPLCHWQVGGFTAFLTSSSTPLWSHSLPFIAPSPAEINAILILSRWWVHSSKISSNLCPLWAVPPWYKSDNTGHLRRSALIPQSTVRNGQNKLHCVGGRNTLCQKFYKMFKMQ